MQGKVEICGVNTSRLSVLSPERTRELLLRVRQGDKAAREELIAGNLRLVLSVIQRFAARGENIDDLFQVGCIGLIKAIDNFDADAHDVRFSTYGVPMIAGEIRRYLRDNSALRVSRSMRDTAYRILQAREKLLAETGRDPTEDEIASSLGIPREEVTFALDAISDPVSLFDPVYTDGGESITVMDQVRDTRNTDDSWLECMALDDAMRRLSPREKRILALRFYDGKTQMEVAGMVGISQAQVSRLEKGAIDRIKKAVFVS
jgi:RNA polymerase sporulation-specific sigma factor